MDFCCEPLDQARFAEALLRWFDSAMRPLPWRETYDPYSVWISEIMLQQTQMERGVRYFEAWMRRFPDVLAVARADEQAVMAAWEGLGYYSRARNLHAAARRIADRHGGVFPRSAAAVRALPGVGEYTAGAILSIAFDMPEPAVDANVLRIFSRLCDIDAPVAGGEIRDGVTAAVRSLMAHGSPRLLSQALMELGALICSRTPKCGVCPVAGFCLALRRGSVGQRPVKKAGAGYSSHVAVAGIVERDGLVFIRQRPAGGLWAGLWEFPGGEVVSGESPEQAVVRHVSAALGVAVSIRKALGTVRHGYTTNRVLLHGYLCGLAEGATPAVSESGVWLARDAVAGHAFPAGARKLLERLGWKSESCSKEK